MPISFREILVVGIPSRALFNLEEENKVFVEQGVVAYRKYQKEREHAVLKEGTGFHVVKALLNLYSLSIERLVEVIVMSKTVRKQVFPCFIQFGI